MRLRSFTAVLRSPPPAGKKEKVKQEGETVVSKPWTQVLPQQGSSRSEGHSQIPWGPQIGVGGVDSRETAGSGRENGCHHTPRCQQCG